MTTEMTTDRTITLDEAIATLLKGRDPRDADLASALANYSTADDVEVDHFDADYERNRVAAVLGRGR